MQITPGYMYFISDDFFKKIHDPNMKWNHHDENTGKSEKRPFFIAFQDSDTDLYWAVPLSSRVGKYKRMIEQRQAAGKECDIIRIAKIQGKESAFLFLDMFPVAAEYIEKQYYRNGQPFHIGSKQGTNRMVKSAKKTKELLKRGIKFCPTQLDVSYVEDLLLHDKETAHDHRMNLVIRNMNQKQARNKNSNRQSLDTLISNAQAKTAKKDSRHNFAEKEAASPSPFHLER